mgnify:CR=1 FL=1
MTQIWQIHADFRTNVFDPRRSAKSVLSACYFAFWIAIVVMMLLASPAVAQEEQRAGLVIVHGDGSVITQCVAFPESSITGAELLARSGLDLAVEASGMGATICRIDGEGCDYPQDACFCQCQSSPCIYWAYWRLTDGAWVYRNAGAGNSPVQPGDVEGWRWGLGTIKKAEPPPDVAFEEICVEEVATPAAAPTAGLDAASDNVVAAESTAATALTLTDPAGASAQTAAGDASLPAEATSLPPLAAFGILFGVLVALPVGAFLIAWLRGAGRRKS